MRLICTLLILCMSITAIAQTGKAKTVKKAFSRTTTISQEINAPADKIWALLSDAKTHESWNSTVVSLKGEIKEGEKLELVSTLAPERTFKLKVKSLVPNKTMIWGDGMGKRTYTLTENNGVTTFSIHEKIGGPMFPLFAGKIPSFDESFEQIASDLKAKAEE